MGHLRQLNRFIMRDDMLPAAVLLVMLIVRLTLLLPGNIFITDEAYYLGVGIEILRSAGWAECYNPYTTGSVYIFPILSGATGALCGRFGIDALIGVRILNILISTLTCGMVYGAARLLAKRWSDDPFVRKWTPVFTTLVYGFSSSSLYIGTLATYDALSIAFLALGIWRLLIALQASGDPDAARAAGKVSAATGQGMNAGLAGSAVALGMMTRFYPLIYTPLLGMMLVLVIPWFLYNRFKLKKPSVCLSSMMVFLISYIVVYGSYLAFSFPYVKAALEWNQRNVDGQSPVPAGQLLDTISDRWGLETFIAGLGIFLLIVPVLGYAIRRLFRRPTPAGGSMNAWKRIFEIAPFALIPLGGLAFQIIGVRNYFAVNKNVAVMILAAAPPAGFFIARAMGAVPKGLLQWLRWFLPVWFFWRYTPKSLDFARKFHVWGGQHHTDAVTFIAKQLGDPPFGEKFAFVQSHIFIAIICAAILLSAVFFAFKFCRKIHFHSIG
jgi:hypothetical protein